MRCKLSTPVTARDDGWRWEDFDCGLLAAQTDGAGGAAIAAVKGHSYALARSITGFTLL